MTQWTQRGLSSRVERKYLRALKKFKRKRTTFPIKGHNGPGGGGRGGIPMETGS